MTTLAWMIAVSCRGMPTSRSMPVPPTCSAVNSIAPASSPAGRPDAISATVTPVNVYPGATSAPSMNR